MTEQEIREIEERAKAATPGPWRAVWTGNTVKSHRVYAEWTGNIACGISPKTGNAEFIAHSREDVPRLTNEVRQAWAECKEREADIKSIGKICAERYDKIAELTAENVRLQIELDKTKRSMEKAIRILQPAPNKEEDLIIGRDCRCDNCVYDGNRANRRKVRCNKGIDGTNGCGLWEPRPERND